MKSTTKIISAEVIISRTRDRTKGRGSGESGVWTLGYGVWGIARYVGGRTPTQAYLIPHTPSPTHPILRRSEKCPQQK